MEQVMRLLILNSAGKEIFNGKITSLPLSEDIIIKKSIEYYNDDSPCFIHRSAVMKRIFFDMENYFKQGRNVGKNEWKAEDICVEILQYFNTIDGFSKVIIL